MKLQISICSTLVCFLALVAGQAKGGAGPADSASDIPHLRRQGMATQLMVDGFFHNHTFRSRSAPSSA